MAEETKEGAQLWVLVAEDNIVNQALVVRIIERAGHKPVVVANGEEAILRLEQRGHFGQEAVEVPPFDLVLMDIQMPVMGGVEATRIIREREMTGGERILVVALTANEIPENQEVCLVNGIDDYLTKPIDSTRLQAIFDGCIERKCARGT